METSQTSLPPFQYLQGLTQECKDLLSSLPTEELWFGSSLYQYCGFWHTPKQLQGTLSCQQNFQAHDTDLLLVSIPKSGTTWLKAISFAIVNRVQYPCTQHQKVHPLLNNNPHDLVPFLEFHLYADNPVPDLSSFSSPRLFSTHLPPVSLPQSIKDLGCKVVYLCRNPKDTFISFWHFINRLRPKTHEPIPVEETFDKFCRGVSPSGPFWDHVLGYWKESLERPQCVLFLKYEEMKEQPALHLRRIADFLGYPFTQEEDREGVVDEILRLCSFESLSNLDVNQSGEISSLGVKNSLYFRRGEVGDWVNYLTSEMIDRLDQITEQKLHGSGLTF